MLMLIIGAEFLIDNVVLDI